MPSRQVRDILEVIRSIHRGLAHRYEAMSSATDHERFRTLLADMGQHELRIDNALADYEQGAANAQLETWLQFGAEEELQRLIETTDLNATLPPEELVHRAMVIDNALVAQYRELQATTSVPEIEDLFVSLVALQESKQRHYAHAITELTMD